MSGFLQHLRTRLGAVLRSPFALLMTSVLGVVTLMMWPIFRPAQVSDLEGGIEILIRALMIWLFPFMVAIFITGRMWSLGEGAGLATLIFPTLPVAPRTRTLAEATGGLLLLLIPRLAVGLVLPFVFVPGSTWHEAVAAGSLWRDSLMGALVLLPVLVACCAPAARDWFQWTRSLVVAVLMAGLVTIGLTRSLVLTAAVALPLAALILAGYRMEPGFDPGSFRFGKERYRLHRAGIDPLVRFRRDLWQRPLHKFWPVILGMVVITLVTPPLMSWLGIPEVFYSFTAGVLPGLAIFLLMFPLGIHLFNGDRGIAGSGGNCGNFKQAWSHLPLPTYRVMRGIWIHGMIGGLVCWALYLTHFVLMMVFSGEWTALVWFHVSLVLAIPAGAGFLVSGAAGDGFRLTLAIAALIAVPAADIGFTIGLKSAGFAMSQNQQIFVVFAAALAAALIGGLPPLIHLRRPRPQPQQGRSS
jgi:hypothetical protein